MVDKRNGYIDTTLGYLLSNNLYRIVKFSTYIID